MIRRLSAALLLVLTAAAPAPAPAPAAPATPAMLAVIDTALTDGRLDTARELLARAWAGGVTPPLQLRAAEVALAGGSLPEAADIFAELTTAPDLAAIANQGLGITRLRQGKTAEAVTALDAALAADPSLLRAWVARGVAADRLQDWTTADAAYARALALKPDAPDILSNRGYSQLLRGHYSQAESDLARAVALAPKLAVAQTNLRMARAMQGRYEQAFAGATRDTLADDLNTVGFAAMARGDYKVAEAYFNRALALNTRFDRTAWANLQYLKSLQGPPQP